MSPRLVLPLLILLLAGAAGVLWAVSGGDEAEELPQGVGPGSAATPQTGISENGALPERRERLPERDAQSDTSTTVAIPLELELVLLEAEGRLDADDAPPQGYAASAGLRGSMHHADGRGAQGHVVFIAGPNRGRVLDTDSLGSFGANDLLPGLSLVALRSSGTPGAEREVLLRRDRQSQLNVGFGRPAIVRGRVKDEQNRPLPTAKVTMDGQDALTDEEGTFYFSRMTSGKVPIYVSKPGYATHREMQQITAGMTIGSDRLTFVLKKAASLVVSVPARVGTGKAGELHLSGPLDGTGQRSYPWHKVSPVSIYAGESVRIEDLPAGRIRLQLFVPGAQATPPVLQDTLVAGVEKTLRFNLEPAPILVGVVREEGKPVEGAVVTLEAPDVTSSAIQALGGGFGGVQFEMDTLGMPLAALQRAVTGADGAFRFSSGEELAPVRYLSARGPDGRSWAGRVVRAEQREVELELESLQSGRAGFVFETSERFQALPIKLVVDGRHVYEVLPAGERLEVLELPMGRWSLRSSWGNEVMQEDVVFDLREVEDVFVPLPDGAINGQSEEMRAALNPAGTKGP